MAAATAISGLCKSRLGFLLYSSSTTRRRIKPWPSSENSEWCGTCKCVRHDNIISSCDITKRVNIFEDAQLKKAKSSNEFGTEGCFLV